MKKLAIYIGLIIFFTSILWATLAIRDSGIKPIKDGISIEKINLSEKLTEPVRETLSVVEYIEPPRPVEASYSVSGDKAAWLSASGIPESEWWAVDWIVSRESGWKPCAFYPSQNDCSANPSTACGLVQQYPCHKIPGDWRDPVVALKWQYSYVNKFGGYAGAVEYWKTHGNY